MKQFYRAVLKYTGEHRNYFSNCLRSHAVSQLSVIVQGREVVITNDRRVYRIIIRITLNEACKSCYDAWLCRLSLRSARGNVYM